MDEAITINKEGVKSNDYGIDVNERRIAELQATIGGISRTLRDVVDGKEAFVPFTEWPGKCRDSAARIYEWHMYPTISVNECKRRCAIDPNCMGAEFWYENSSEGCNLRMDGARKHNYPGQVSGGYGTARNGRGLVVAGSF